MIMAIALVDAKQQKSPASAGVAQQDHYAVLGLERSAETTQADVRNAYRKLSLQWHPDKNPGDEKALKRFQEIANAYEVLGDPDKRAVYDSYGGEHYQHQWEYEEAMRKSGKKGQAGKVDFYVNSDLVESLTTKSFQEKIYNKQQAFMVEYYAPWCVHCQQLTGEWKKAAILLEGIVKFGAVNCEANKQLCEQRGIGQYPTIQLIIAKDDIVEWYQGAHTAEAIYSFVQAAKTSKVAALSVNTLVKSLASADKVWLVDFSAGQWCGPCTFLKGQLRQTAYELEGVANVGIFDCDKDRQWCQDNGVPYYPFLKVFPVGSTMATGFALEYNQQMAPAGNMLNLFSLFAKAFVKRPAGNHTAGAQMGGEDADDDAPPQRSPDVEEELDRVQDEL